MTHDELLAKINGFSCCSGAHELALRAVVKLHIPEHWAKWDVDFCLGCKDEYYPCPTIQAIEKELE
jgi:hypothetical protein